MDSNTILLRKKAYQGLNDLGFGDNLEYLNRLNFELETIEHLGFSSYFLIVWDIASFVRRQGLVPAPGRGSVAGSLLAYVLGITLVDPIKFDLPFERFMSKDRVSAPDIDYDTSDRDLIISYLESRYGKDKVARVGTLGFMRTKSAIRDVCRVLDKPREFTDELAKLVPPPVAGLWTSFDDEANVSPRLLDSKYADVVEIVRKLWGIVRSHGTHAGGVVIAPEEVTNFIPLYKGKDDNPTSQFDYRDLEKTGLLKFDILGLSTLKVIQTCVDLLKKEGIFVDLEHLSDEDPASYDLICRGDLDGIFQLGGSEGIKELCVAIQPKNIHDLSVASALFRPGPLSSGQVDQYASARSGKEDPVYLNDTMRKILSPTYNVVVFQEQVMKICTDLCGYTSPESYAVMKMLGKKQQDKLAAEAPKFIAGAIEGGLTKIQAEKLFDQLKDYGQYLFNACLSADTEVLVKTHDSPWLPGEQEPRVHWLPKTIGQLSVLDKRELPELLSYNSQHEIVEDQCLEVISTGKQEVYEIKLSDGSSVTCTMDHQFLCGDMVKRSLREILDLDLDIVSIAD